MYVTVSVCVVCNYTSVNEFKIILVVQHWHRIMGVLHELRWAEGHDWDNTSRAAPFYLVRIFEACHTVIFR